MSLSFDDFQTIRTILREELTPLENRLEAVENDVQDVYFIISDMQEDIKGLKKLVKA